MVSVGPRPARSATESARGIRIWLAVLACGAGLTFATPGPTHAASDPPGRDAQAHAAGAVSMVSMDGPRVRRDMGRVLAMERQTLADLEGVGHGNLARRAQAAWATVADTATIAGVLRDARTHGLGCALDGQGKAARTAVCTDLAALAAWNRGTAAAAGILGDLAELGTIGVGWHARTVDDLAAHRRPAARWRPRWQRALRDARTRLRSLGPAADTPLGRAEQAEIGLLKSATQALAGRAPWADGLRLAARLRRSTAAVGDAVDPYRALVRRRVAALVAAAVQDVAGRTRV